MDCDTLIVGAGSAGAVLAGRLSEDPGVRVLLVEAGPDYATRAATPADVLDSRDLAGMAHDWGYSAQAVAGRRIPYRRGKVSGGTSAINAVAAQWGRAEDFAAWAARGLPEWEWEQVAPWYRAVEDDPVGAKGRHGREGAIAIARYADDELIPVQRGLLDACLAAGFARVDDHNAAQGSGVGAFPLSREGTTRISTALAYLGPARARPGLAIRARTEVAHVRFDGKRACGVELIGGETIAARRVVLCAGAIGSPAILLRSGIGPTSELAAHGIEPLLDAPGVGATLWDHPAAPVYLRPRPGECVPGRDPRLQVMACFTADGSTERDDMQLVMTSHLDLASAPALRAAAGVPVVAVLRAALMLPRASGRVRLAGADPNLPPVIELNFLADAEDRRRLRLATRLAWQLARSEPLARRTDGVVAPAEFIVASDERLDAYLHEQVGTYCHALGTVPMGPRVNAGAVLDGRCRVYGVDGLWVADASVMPAPPRVVPNLSVMMIAERVADWLRRDGGPE